MKQKVGLLGLEVRMPLSRGFHGKKEEIGGGEKWNKRIRDGYTNGEKQKGDGVK